jgi:putative Holliday junction resolvase
MPDALMAAAAPPVQPPDSRPRSGTSAATTILAFDFGLARIGVAVGDAGQRSAHPLAAVHAAADAERFEAIGRIVAEWQPGRLVVGVPQTAAGEPMARRAERFARQLEGRFHLPVSRVDESFSSTEAESRLRDAAGARRVARLSRGRQLDSFAAQLLLEQYFNGMEN